MDEIPRWLSNPISNHYRIYGIFALSIKDGPLKNKFQRDSEITPEECFSILTARIKLKMILSFSNKPSQISVNIDLVI